MIVMSRKYRIQDQSQPHFVTFTVIHWLDVFTRKDYPDIFLDSIRYCQKQKGLEVYAYCVMSSHVHMMIGRNGEEKMEHIIRDIKKFTSFKIIDAIKSNGEESRKDLLIWLFERAGKRPDSYRDWQQNNHLIELSNNRLIENTLLYIHNNPVVAGIVVMPEHYLYSSAVNYADLPEKLIDVIFI
jgi:REP element-mobilizing transposase RayT